MSAVQVSFYVLQGPAPATRLGYACQLIEQAYKDHRRIHAHTANSDMAKSLDDLLWTFRQSSFIPHERLVKGSEISTSITISAPDSDGEVPPPADLLINLADSVPEFFNQYAQIVEVIDDSPGCREAGRLRHRFYQRQGLAPKTEQVT